MVYDPGLTRTAACRSAITYIDGEAGVLQHRGYRIEALCEYSTFLEVAYLLIHGELPTAAQLDRWMVEINTRNFVHENVKGFLEGVRYDAHPIAMLAASVGALSSFYPDAGEVHDDQARERQVVRLLAKMPTLAAFSYRHLQGQPYVYPEDDLSYAGNLLSMMFRISELRYRPSAVPEFLARVKTGHERLMGFGHWVYKTHDPRARILRARLEELYEARSRKNPPVEITDELSKRALEDEYFNSHRLYPNLDLYSGLTYEAIGVPPPMFPVMFALARSAGWIAQWLEMVKDPEQTTVRPRQLYTGELDRDYVPVERRL